MKLTRYWARRKLCRARTDLRPSSVLAALFLHVVVVGEGAQGAETLGYTISWLHSARQVPKSSHLLMVTRRINRKARAVVMLEFEAPLFSLTWWGRGPAGREQQLWLKDFMMLHAIFSRAQSNISPYLSRLLLLQPIISPLLHWGKLIHYEAKHKTRIFTTQFNKALDLSSRQLQETTNTTHVNR